MRFLIIMVVLVLLALGGIGFFLGGEETVARIEIPVEKQAAAAQGNDE